MSIPRLPNERADQPSDGAVERLMPNLLTEGLPDRLERNRPVVVACAGGRRAAIAASLLLTPGYRPAILDGAGVAELVRMTPIGVQLRAMSCTGPNGRGVDRSSHAPTRAGMARSNPSRKARTRLVLPRPAPPLTSATRPDPALAEASAAARQSSGDSRSRSSMDRP